MFITLSIASGMYALALIAADVSMDVANRTVTGTTSNVTTLDLVPPIPLPAFDETADISITLDGQSFVMTPKTDMPYLRFRHQGDSKGKVVWGLDPSCRDGSKPSPLLSTDKRKRSFSPRT